MTTLQKTVVNAVLLAAVIALLAAGVVMRKQARQVTVLREQIQALQQAHAALGEKFAQAQRERETATNRVAALTDELASVKKQPTEVFKLRGEVGALRQEKAAIGSKSALNKITADPETRKLMREQQKMGMTAIYTELLKRLKLAPETTGQFHDLLADHVMDSIDLITQSLHDKKSRAEIDRVFSSQDLVLRERVATLLGQEGLAQYLDYSKDLVTGLTAVQFEGNLTGDKEAKADKRKQLAQALQDETRAALTAAGLPADYQAVPILNFRNIASEEQAEQSLKLLEGIYARVAGRANSFLEAEELKKLQEFTAKAIENNRAALLMNRKLMAPISN